MAYLQGDDDEDLPPMERPVMDQQEIAETGEGLVSNRFTVSESFKKLETGEAPSVFSGTKTGRETVFKSKAPEAPKPLQSYDARLCAVCGEKLKGKFAKIQGRGLHFDCFKCSVCGENLRGQGYFGGDGVYFCRKDRP
ncbi:actin-binding LIM protein 2-like [Patiria miniata]|uniref:LIM zinc-binding domain-containing protein n=1 Tax=Patiria miniata TaxID=46514 RepID=A0A914B3D6_PATMI|nr:actin-binding LIM protein 2-like [Patiria miniata]